MNPKCSCNSPSSKNFLYFLQAQMSFVCLRISTPLIWMVILQVTMNIRLFPLPTSGSHSLLSPVVLSETSSQCLAWAGCKHLLSNGITSVHHHVLLHYHFICFAFTLLNMCLGAWGVSGGGLKVLTALTAVCPPTFSYTCCSCLTLLGFFQGSLFLDFSSLLFSSRIF